MAYHVYFTPPAARSTGLEPAAVDGGVGQEPGEPGTRHYDGPGLLCVHDRSATAPRWCAFAPATPRAQYSPHHAQLCRVARLTAVLSWLCRAQPGGSTTGCSSRWWIVPATRRSSAPSSEAHRSSTWCVCACARVAVLRCVPQPCTAQCVCGEGGGVASAGRQRVLVVRCGWQMLLVIDVQKGIQTQTAEVGRQPRLARAALWSARCAVPWGAHLTTGAMPACAHADGAVLGDRRDDDARHDRRAEQGGPAAARLARQAGEGCVGPPHALRGHVNGSRIDRAHRSCRRGHHSARQGAEAAAIGAQVHQVRQRAHGETTTGSLVHARA